MKKQEEMLIAITELLNNYNVLNFLMFGTLLGAIRDKKLIEKDDIDKSYWNSSSFSIRRFR